MVLATEPVISNGKPVDRGGSEERGSSCRRSFRPFVIACASQWSFPGAGECRTGSVGLRTPVRRVLAVS
jgi:hypothetical protein